MFNKIKSPYIHKERVHNLNAPGEVVPYLIRLLNPKSIVDVGCGLGTWLKVFEQEGVNDFIGIDGPHLNTSKVVIDKNKIHIKDINHSFTIDRTFDLAICLEVAEHLHLESADGFIDSLTRLSNIILFSAAIPLQGGQNHINEQWPTYWEEKFQKHDFYFSDCIRGIFWENPQVDWWYKQNMFFVCHESMQHILPKTNTILNIVHPIVFLEARKLKGVANSYKVK